MISQDPQTPQSIAAEPLIPVITLKLARAKFEKTLASVGAGHLLFVFLPGSDMMLRSFHGLDTSEECIAMAREVATLMRQEVARIESAKPPKGKTNE
jgi:hypothetical protein